MKLIKIILITCICTFCFPTTVQASEQETEQINDENIEYDNIQETINGILDSDRQFNFKEYVYSVLSGEKSLTLESIMNDIKSGCFTILADNFSVIAKLLFIAVIAAIFTNFATVFTNTQIGNTGFYITYLLLFSTLIVSFITVNQIAVNTLNALITFMQALLPSYLIAVTFCSSVSTSLAFYEAILFAITMVDKLLITIIIPMINIYLVVNLANNLSREDILSKLSEFISTLIRWTLRTLLAVIIGFETIQSMIAPVSSGFKRNVLTRIISIVPVVGNTLSGVAQSVYGAGVLLKNAIGVAGLIVIISICLMPLIKLLVTELILKFSSAVIQPISDKRIVNCISTLANTIGLLLQTVLVGIVLFVVSITIVAVSIT